MSKFDFQLKPIYSFILLMIFIMSLNRAKAQNFCSDIILEDSSPLTFPNYVRRYSEILSGVKEMIDLGLERYNGKKPNGYCYRAVKELLIDSGLIWSQINGTFASSAHTKGFLVDRGFIDLLLRPPFDKLIRGPLDENIPIGAILVFSGANGLDGGVRQMGEGIGHIEIKCGYNCYLFDTVNEFPGGKNQFRQPNEFEAGEGVDRRRLIGVYILDFFSLF